MDRGTTSRLAFGAVIGGVWFVVVDGKEGKQYDGILHRPVFSPDGRHLAYGAGAGEERFVVVDGKEWKHYDSILTDEGGGILFDSPRTLHYIARHMSDVYLVEETLK
jgi:hypothetical protein